MLSKIEYDELAVELEKLKAGSIVTDLSGVKWTKNGDGVWYSSAPEKRNSIALIALLNTVEEKDKNSSKTIVKNNSLPTNSLFD